MSLTFLYYIVSFAVSQAASIMRKPSAMLSSHALSFHPRIMPNAKWSMLGVTANILSLFTCVLLSLSIMAIADQPLDVVLNTLAVFFLLSLDNLLVPRALMRSARTNLQAWREALPILLFLVLVPGAWTVRYRLL